MLVKNEYDRQGVLAIGKIVAAILDELCRAARPGITTAALDHMAAVLLADHGAAPTPSREYDFPGRLCISVNDEVVHGVPGPRTLREGDLVKLDLTADKRGFVADATRMVALAPAAADTLRLAECARRACHAAVAMAEAGMPIRELGGAVHRVVGGEGFAVVKNLCGHGVGRRTHEEPEVPNYSDRTNSDILRQGMVITIEPIISAGSGKIRELADGWTLATVDGSLSAHYEETIIVGENGAEVATTI